jgi:hypothetical protein
VRDHLEDTLLADLIDHDALLVELHAEFPSLEGRHHWNVVVVLPLNQIYLLVHYLHLHQALALRQQQQTRVVHRNHASIMQQPRVRNLHRVQEGDGLLLVVEELDYLLRRNRRPSQVCRFVCLLLVRKGQVVLRVVFSDRVPPQNQNFDFSLLGRGHNDGADPSDGQLDDLGLQLDLPLSQLKNLNKLAPLHDLLLDLGIAPDQQEENAVADVVEIEDRIEHFLLDVDLAQQL